MPDGTWVVSAEVWDDGLILRWVTSARPTNHEEWLLYDDLGTNYRARGSFSTSNPRHGYDCSAQFEPTSPPGATSLRLRRKATGDELSIPLTD
jgi:hypothetical protein